MADDQVLIDYIQNQIRRGYPLDNIKNFLLSQGYDPKQVNSAVDNVEESRIASIKSYINQETKGGYEMPSIKAQLRSYGYTENEVNSASAPKKQKWGILIVIAALVLIGAGLFFIVSSKDNVPLSTEPVQPVQVEPTNNGPSVINNEPSKPEQKFEQPKKVYEVINATQDEKIVRATQMCENTANEIYKDACFDQLSKATRDHSLCEKIVDSVQKDNCFMRTAVYTQNEAICDNIADPHIRSECQLSDYGLAA